MDGAVHGSISARGLDFKRPVALERHTSLLSEDMRAPIGFVTQRNEVECLERCNESIAKVELLTCVGRISVWATVQPKQPRSHSD